MPLIQWIMQNLGMGTPVHRIQGNGGLKTSGTAGVKVGYVYEFTGTLTLGGNARIKFFSIDAVGGLKLDGAAEYSLRKSTTNIIPVVIYEVNPDNINIIRDDLIDDLDVLDGLIIDPDPSPDIGVIRYIASCDIPCDPAEVRASNDRLDVLRSIQVRPDPVGGRIVTKIATANPVDTRRKALEAKLAALKESNGT